MTKPRAKDHRPLDFSQDRYPGDYAHAVEEADDLGLDARYVRCPGGVRCRLFAETVLGDEVGPDVAPVPAICVGVGVGGFRKEALASALRSLYARTEAVYEASVRQHREEHLDRDETA